MTTWDRSLRRELPRERGAIFKDWGGRIPIAIVYPNSYYVGMSNLGFQSLYALLNSHDNIVCERVFWSRSATQCLSIESQRPLSDFAVIAFSVSYELDYFNIIDILKSGSVPLFAADRDDSHPIVIGGGPCITANPQPLSPFFDCLAIGEAEAILPAMVEAITDGIEGSKDELVRTLAAIPGIYAPCLNHDRTVHRQWVQHIDDFATTSVVLTPDTELGQMYLIEVTRGCRWGCRFCMAGYLFRPFRYRSLDNLLHQAEFGLEREKRIGVLGASPCDHPEIEELVTELQKRGAQISVSSLRVRPLPRVVLGELTEGGAQTIALAPEAGSERLRTVINKGIGDADIIEAMDKVSERRFKRLKLYFMIGLPSETDSDIEDIIKLTLAAKACIDRTRAGSRITLTVEPFVPKAGTPFQWLPMASAEVLTHRLSLLRHALRAKGVAVASESANWMTVQGVLSRGDARIGHVLANMEGRTLSSWRRAMDECSLDAQYYVNREIPFSERLPWANIDSGVAQDYLRSELEQARLGRSTPPCPLTECHECGVC